MKNPGFAGTRFPEVGRVEPFEKKFKRCSVMLMDIMKVLSKGKCIYFTKGAKQLFCHKLHCMQCQQIPLQFKYDYNRYGYPTYKRHSPSDGGNIVVKAVKHCALDEVFGHRCIIGVPLLNFKN